MGIVAAVLNLITDHKGCISEALQFGELEICLFFMRYEVVVDSAPFDLEELKEKSVDVAEKHEMHWEITGSTTKKQFVMMVSQKDHYLSDLLYRWRAGAISIEIPCLIPNHDTLRSYVEWHGIPLIHVPVHKSNKVEHVQTVEEQIAAAKSDSTFLAKHMHIIRESPCELYSGRIINIHHSILPSFISARLYRQLAARGAKQIGNNCHHVTPDLDAGRNCEGGVAGHLRILPYPRHQSDDRRRIVKRCPALGTPPKTLQERP